MTISSPTELSGTAPSVPVTTEAAESDSTVTANTSRINADESAVRDFLRGLAQLQGQLPTGMVDKQQTLLRQLSTLLTPNNLANNATAGGATAQSELFARIISQLPAADPLPRMLINQLLTSAPATIYSTQNSPLLTTALNNLPAFINSSSEPGKAFWSWLNQLAALRLVDMPDITLQKQLQQQAVRLLPNSERSQTPAIQLATELTVRFIVKLAENTNIKLPTTPTALNNSATNSDDTTPNKLNEISLTKSNITTDLAKNITALVNKHSSDLIKSIPQVSLPDAAAKISTEINKQTPIVTAGVNNSSAAAGQGLHIESINALAKALSIPTLSFGDYIHTLNTLLERKLLPTALQTPLRQLISVLSPQIQSAEQVREWVSFIQNPLLGETTNSKGLQQWALSLLNYHLLRNSASGNNNSEGKPLPHSGLPSLPTEESQSTLNKTATQFIQQMEKLQSPLQENNTLLLLNIPLPPQYPGGKENFVKCHQGRNEQGKHHWTLTFMLDLEHLGLLQVKAMLDIPDITLQMTAEKLQTCDLIKKTWPSLDARLRELGLAPGPLLCKQGKIKNDVDNDGVKPEGLSIRV